MVFRTEGGLPMAVQDLPKIDCDGRVDPRFGRILEVGEHCLIGRALPICTDFACTSLAAPPGDLPADLRRLSPTAAIHALRANAYGLVIAHAPAYSGMQAS